MRMCEDEKVWRWKDVKMRRCENKKIEDEKMWRRQGVKMRRCEDEKTRRCEDEKIRRCEDEKMWRCENIKWEDVKMFENVNNRPPLIEEPFALGKNEKVRKRKDMTA